MSNELEQVTVSTDGSSWVDNVPGTSVSGSYQAQNTSSESVRTGIDNIVVEATAGDSATVRISGPIDDNGILFSVKSEVLFTSLTPGRYYLRLTPGDSVTDRNISTTSSQPIFVPEKNAYYDGANQRMLNSVIVVYDEVDSSQRCEIVSIKNLPFNSFYESSYSLYTPIRWIDKHLVSWMGSPERYGQMYNFGGDNTSITQCCHHYDNKLYFSNFYELSGNDRVWIGNYLNGTRDGSIDIGPNNKCVGIADFSGQMVTVNSINNTIIIWSSISPGATPVSSFSTPGTYPAGICIIDGDLYSVDRENNEIFIHDGVSATIKRSFILPTAKVLPQFDSAYDIAQIGNDLIISVMKEEADIIKYLYLVVDVDGNYITDFWASVGDVRGIAVNSKRQLLSVDSLNWGVVRYK